jgi:hypothetical protein
MSSAKSSNSNRRSFDYTAALARVCGDFCFRVPELSHIDMSRVAVSFAQTKHSAPFGTFATTTPMRFKDGDLLFRSRGKMWTLQRCYRSDGAEYLYILYFYVPRFIELKLTPKLETIVHELYHISPNFNGDLRRFPGRCFAHGTSQKKYDRTVHHFVQHWLNQNPPQKIWNFLQYSYNGLIAEFGDLYGTRIPTPKIIPVVK